MSKADDFIQDDYRVSVRMTKDDVDRLERLQGLLQVRKGRSVRVTQRTVIVEALEVFERELTRKRKGASDS